MNFNAIIAVLVIKSIITNDEAEKLVEHLNDKPQSTVLRDAIAAVSEVIAPQPTAAILPQLGPIGPAQQAEEIAARTAAAATPPPAEEPAPAEPEAEEKAEPVDKPETDKDSKVSSVKKATDKPAKK